MAETIERDLRTDEVAKLLQLHIATVQRLLINKQLKGYKIGRHWRIPPKAVRNFQQDNLEIMELQQIHSDLKIQPTLQTPYGTASFIEKPVTTKARDWKQECSSEEFQQGLKKIKQMSKGIPPLPLKATRRKHLYGNADR